MSDVRAAGGWPARWLPAALAFGCAALLFERISPQSFFDPDGYHQMALFREWLRTGALPHVDTFAFTHTIVPAVQHEWGAGAVLYLLATRLGAGGVMVARWLISGAIVAIAARTAGRRATPMVVAFCAAPAALLGAVAFTTLRAGLYTMLFLAIVLALIDRDRDQPRPGRFLLVWLPLAALWINLHGGWLVGAVAIGLHAGEQLIAWTELGFAQRSRRGRFREGMGPPPFQGARLIPRRPCVHLLAALAAVPALMALTPYGRDYFIGWWHSITFPRAAVAEWAPLAHSPYVLGLAAFGLAILLAVYAVARRGPRACPGLLFVLATAWAAWRHERHVALFALAWFCAVPGWLAATPLGVLLDGAVARRRVAGLVAIASLGAGLGLVAVALPRHPFTLRVPAQGADVGHVPVVYPAGATAYLKDAGFHGKLVTSFVNGGFVAWQLHPAARISFDGRYEVAYAPEVMDEDRTIHGARPGWSDVLGRYAPDAVLVLRDEPLAGVLPGPTGLARVYRDDAYEVWARPGLGLQPRDVSGQSIAAAFP